MDWIDMQINAWEVVFIELDGIIGIPISRL